MILVTGATGNVGSELVTQLAAEKQPVRALVRDPGRITLPGEVEVVAGDLDRPASLAPALDGVRALFLLGGHRDMPGLLGQIREAGVRHVVLLSSRSVVGGRCWAARCASRPRLTTKPAPSSGAPRRRSSSTRSSASSWRGSSTTPSSCPR